MNKGIFSAKLAASTRKAKKIIPEVKSKSASSLVANKNKAKKVIPKVKSKPKSKSKSKSKSTSSLVANKNKAKRKISRIKPKSAPLPELESPNDLLNPTDSELPLKQQYAERIWPD
jgi:hypothetical protein